MENFENELVAKSMFPLMSVGARLMEADFPKDFDSDQFTIPASSLPTCNDSQGQTLCTPCSKINMAELDSEAGYQHYNDVQDLFISAENCDLCKMIRIQLCSSVKFHVERDEPIINVTEMMELFATFMARQGFLVLKPAPVILKIDRSRGASLDRLVAIGTRLISLERGQFALALYWGRLLLHDNKKDSKRPLRPRGGEPEVLERLAAWLHERQIELPSVESWERPLPNRALDLGEAQKNQTSFLEGDISLAETAGQQGQYVALSYCWGGFTDFRTLKNNYQDRLQSNKFESLPKVFAEAVKITRALGVRYLWIDALCIIQEDSEDWNREAACMSNIYWNTTCRLAVTGSRNPTESFFPPKDIVASVRVPGLSDMNERQGVTSPTAQFVPGTLTNPKTQPPDEARPKEKGWRKKIRPFNIPTKKGDSAVSQTRSQTSGEPDDAGPNETSLESSAGDNDQSPSHNSSNGTTEDLLNTHQQISVEEPDETDLSEQFEEESGPTEMYLTMIKSYTLDVDRGLLNSRAWVLQERLLSPRTIHFTQDHIYCEDQDDMCGEDWVRRYFTWLSSIHKVSEFSQIDMFPERSFTYRALHDSGRIDRLFFQRSMYKRAESQHIPDPWLWISKKFSRCHLSYETDKLAAFAGLVEKKRLDANGDEKMGKPLLGLWDSTLHVDLAWIVPKHSKVRYCHELNLPSWAWISYTGAIDFVKENRKNWRHNPRIVHTPPISEFHMLEADVPEMTVSLPLAKPSSLTISAFIQQIRSISRHNTDYGTKEKSRKELAASSPFHFSEKSETIPVALASLSNCQEIYDEGGELIGFVSFDEEKQTVGDMFCAHISSLQDAGEFMLAHALVLMKFESGEGCFRRVGLAEVNYDWMKKGVRTVLKLF